MTREELVQNITHKKSFLCVGLDTDLKKIPQHLLAEADPIFAFNKAIIDATAPYCVAYKPNLAFYECFGLKGWEAFEKTVRYIRENYPDEFIIADAKRGDIGNTSKMYAKSFFETLNVDALTVAPYMGEDSVTPFLGYPDKWMVLLALTSNKGSHDFQHIAAADGGDELFEAVIKENEFTLDNMFDWVKEDDSTGNTEENNQVQIEEDKENKKNDNLIIVEKNQKNNYQDGMADNFYKANQLKQDKKEEKKFDDDDDEEDDKLRKTTKKICCVIF